MSRHILARHQVNTLRHNFMFYHFLQAKGRIPSMRVPGCYGDHEIGDKCQKQFIESPKIENATIKNDPTRDSRQGDAVQMQPQIVRLALPVGTYSSSVAYFSTVYKNDFVLFSMTLGI